MVGAATNVDDRRMNREFCTATKLRRSHGEEDWRILYVVDGGNNFVFNAFL